MLRGLDSCFTRPLAVAADDLDLVCGHRSLIVQLEGHILDEERPDFIAESVGIEVALRDKRAIISFIAPLKQSPTPAVPQSGQGMNP